MYEEEDYFNIGDQFHEDEVPIEKLKLQKKKLVNKSGINLANASAISDMKSTNGNLDQAFIDKSRIDTSNMMDDGSILGPLKNEKMMTLSSKLLIYS